MPAEIDKKLKELNIFLNRAFKYLLANHELLNIRKQTTQGIRNALAFGRVVNNAPYGIRIFVMSMVSQHYKLMNPKQLLYKEYLNNL